MSYDYARVSSNYWTGNTGREIKQLGAGPQLLGLYLMSGPHRHSVGIYYLPTVFITHELAITEEEVSDALVALASVGFSFYDFPSEHVWLPNMARMQIGESLVKKDKKWINVTRELTRLIPRIPQFVAEFCDLYGDAYNLKDIKELVSPFEAPSKPLRSKEKEKEKEKEAERRIQNQEKEEDEEQKLFATSPLILTLKDGGIYEIPEEKPAEWEILYPSLDIHQEIRNLQGYYEDPRNRKTRRGITRAIHNWFRMALKIQRAGNGSGPKFPGWKIEMMQKAIRMTTDTYIGTTPSDEQWVHTLKGHCQRIGVQWSVDLQKAALE